MISYYGISNPSLQEAIINLCFYEDQSGVSIIDEAISNDALSGEQMRMLPMLFTKAPLHQFSTYSQSRIKGMYKHTLCRNHFLLLEAINFQKQLKLSGYKKVIFLKGVAHLLYAKKNLGQRPMADIDILIPEFINNIEKSLSFIEQENFEIKSFGAREVSIVNRKHSEFDIHWYLNHGALKKITIDKMIAKSITIKYLNYDLLVPCYEHQLAHLLVHGVFAPTLTYDARWIIDVLDLLSFNENINPDIFLDFINDFTLPSKIKHAIDLVLNHADPKLKFDRKSLEEVSKRIQSRKYFLEYFYDQKPRPNIAFFENKKNFSWVKSGICTHIIEPIMISRFNNVPFLKSLGLTLGFPPPSLGKIIYLIFDKIYQRLFYKTFAINKKTLQNVRSKIK